MRFTGCPFAERCPEVEDGCRAEAPELREVAEEHQVSCHRV
jgi:oligopeptide/dipeptide ABC transporter ATP-binding protein